MSTPGSSRFGTIAALLLIATFWSFTAATGQGRSSYPGNFLVSGQWLKAHIGDPDTVVVDVRRDKYFDGRVIPGAVRMPLSLFRIDNPVEAVGSQFAGAVPAQEILGAHGISREDTVILYDSVKRDGGATSSYVFWVLESLGHKKIKLLDRGIDGWADAGGEVTDTPVTPEPVLYQAPADELNVAIHADGEFIHSRLGDPHYVILDVRSPEEYMGEKGNKAYGGGGLKLGHIPTAVNIEYKLNWTDKESKEVKDYAGLLELYRGIDPSTTIILFCHSGRRASYTYFILRLMGFTNIKLYESSWYEWGSFDRFFPVEIEERKLSGAGLPTDIRKAQSGTQKTGEKGGATKGGYVSCGG